MPIFGRLFHTIIILVNRFLFLRSSTTMFLTPQFDVSASSLPSGKLLFLHKVPEIYFLPGTGAEG